MDKALVFGTKDCRFESCQGHLFVGRLVATAFGSVACVALVPIDDEVSKVVVDDRLSHLPFSPWRH